MNCSLNIFIDFNTDGMRVGVFRVFEAFQNTIIKKAMWHLNLFSLLRPT